jgi:NAD(P)-dependent dehydrogenase (short-subunit alcohol dehydrogenase family)
MRTTLDLDGAVLRAAKKRAAEEGKSLTHLIEEALREFLTGAKAAQRSLAESMARYLWLAGIHVALVMIDGVVDLERTRQRMPDKPDEFFVRPDAVAETVFHLARQDRSAWSFGVEARPFGERW